MAHTLDSLAKTIRLINTNNGWNVLKKHEWDDEHKIPAIIALIHSEASEALEAFRKNDQDNFREELIDVVIRCLDCLGAWEEISIDEQFLNKMDINRNRAWKHGGKRI